MSLQLLRKLNGNRNGKFKELLDSFADEPNIAWYPSAGEDFRDLMYLSHRYLQSQPEIADCPPPPSIFLHTDYFPWTTSTFLDHPVFYTDNRTTITAEQIEELPSIYLPLDPGIVDFPEGSHATNRVLFIRVNINSETLGIWSVPLIYVFAENAAFLSELALPNRACFSHMIHVRHGGGCGGGGKSSGIWMTNVVKRVNCKLFITDEDYNEQDGDRRIYELYPQLMKPDTYQTRIIRLTPSASWSYYGDVYWKRIN